MTQVTVLALLLGLGVPPAAWAGPPPGPAVELVEEAEKPPGRGEAPPAAAVEEGEPSPPSRAAAFAGAYMASTGLGIAWVANVAAIWALAVVGVLFPPLAALGAFGVCTSGVLLCALPVGQGVLGSMLGEAMGGYDAWLAHVLTVAAAFVSTAVAGGALLLASAFAIGLLANSLVGPYQTTSFRPDGTVVAALVPTSFAAQVGVTMVLALFVTLLQPLVPAAVFALTTSTSIPSLDARRERRQDRRERRKMRREREREDDDEAPADDGPPEQLEVRPALPPVGTSVAMGF